MQDRTSVTRHEGRRREPGKNDPRSRGAVSSRRWDSEAESGATILPIYLREMGATPLLGSREEAEVARELQLARAALARLARRLPSRCREYVLEGDPAGRRRGREWPLERLERFHDRLRRYAREHPEGRVERLARDSGEIKRRVDRAREALILANLRLVIFLAKKYVRHGVSFLDLIQEGNLGLMKAVEKFEWERGNKFSTYAYWWIKQAIERAIADKGRLIRVPVHVTEKMKKIQRAASELQNDPREGDGAEEIANSLGMSPEKVREVIGVVRDAQAFEDFLAEEDGPGLLGVVEDPDSPCPLERMADRQLRDRVEEAIRTLAPREQEIIRMRFGIGRDAARTLEEIGRALGLSRERVRQIENTALRKIESARGFGELRDLVG